MLYFKEAGVVSNVTMKSNSNQTACVEFYLLLEENVLENRAAHEKISSNGKYLLISVNIKNTKGDLIRTVYGCSF